MLKKHINTILILGDSTSMSIGVEKLTHVFINAQNNIWPTDTLIVNSSLPGMTAADSAAFYFRHRNLECKNLKAVFIYLGNCDTTSTEFRKGKYDKYIQYKNKFTELLNIKRSKTSIKNKLLYFEWNNTFNPKIENAESPEDFVYNLERIIKDCKINQIPVILVRPKANKFFPSGVGKGNFTFYKYLGIDDKISNNINIPDTRFKDALKLHENHEYEVAAQRYKEILIKPSTEIMSQEYSLMVANNYAVAKALLGNYKEAIYVLNLLLNEKEIRKEIILYNLSQTYKMQGSIIEAKNYLDESFESDKSLYRVRYPYINAIDNIISKYDAIKVIDMHTLIPDYLFLDHCHPLPKGQEILANAIKDKFKEIGIHGFEKAKIKNILYNPEFANGNNAFFHDYFKTFAPYTVAEIKSQVDLYKNNEFTNIKYLDKIPEVSNSSRELKIALDYYLKHPVFTGLHDILYSPPKYPSDIGRFPEFYLIRYLIPYIKLYESIQQFDSNIDFDYKLLRSSEDLISILPIESVAFIENKLPDFDLKYEEQRLERILVKSRKSLIQHLINGNQIYNRTKATIFWYVRETLRFGSHSRYSMRYDRLTLEYIAEGLAVAKILNYNLGNKKSQAINKLITDLNLITKIHEEFCVKFDLVENNQILLMEYDKSLKEIHKNII
jgi:hypothetical protein